MGRTDELDRLAGITAAVVSGDRRVALISGEPGVGKSRLVAEFVRLVREQCCRVMVGRCVELGDQIWPLAALRELLACLVDELDDETLDLALGGARAALGHLVPELGGGSSSASVAVDRDKLCESVIEVLQRLGQWGPIVVVIEDLHWADPSTRALFSLLARSSRPTSMLLVGTYRSELARRHSLRPVLAEIVRATRPEQVDLERFDRDRTAELVSAIAPDTIGAPAIEDIHRLSEGNAFFIEELVSAHLAGVTGFPRSLRELILARTSTLPDPAVDLLSIVAVAGRIPSAVLAMTAGVDGAVMATHLDELMMSGLLVFDGEGVRFAHELARNVVVDEIAPDALTVLHAELARSLTALRPQRLGEIARHWSAANRPGPALVSWVAAGRLALHDGAPSEAVGHFSRALDLWNVVEDAESLVGTDLAALLVDAASAAYNARCLDRAIELATRAADELAGRDPWREGDVWLRLRAMYRFSARWDECAAALDHALEVIPRAPPSFALVEALADAALGHRYASRVQDARVCAEEALAIATSLADPDAIVLARYAMGAAPAIDDSTHESGVEFARATLAMCDQDVSPDRTLLAYNGLANSLAEAGRCAELVDVAAAGVALVRSSGLGGPLGTSMASFWLGSLVTLGRWTEAEALRGELDDLFVHAERDPFLCMEKALIRQGRLDEVCQTMEHVRALLREPDYWTEDLCELGAVLIEFDVARGGQHDVVAMVDGLLDRSRTRLPLGEWGLVGTAIAALGDRLARTRHRPPGDDPTDLEMVNSWLRRLTSRAETLGREDEVGRERAYAELSRLRGSPDAEAWSNLAESWEELGMRVRGGLREVARR